MCKIDWDTEEIGLLMQGYYKMFKVQSSRSKVQSLRFMVNCLSTLNFEL